MRSLCCAALFLLVGCGGGAMSAPSDERCPNNGSSVDLAVAPAELARGAGELIYVDWHLYGSVDAAVAKLLAGANQEIEVELPLLLDTDTSDVGSFTYSGQLQNPFGAGAPAGEVVVVASGKSTGCFGEATASTSFLLQ